MKVVSLINITRDIEKELVRFFKRNQIKETDYKILFEKEVAIYFGRTRVYYFFRIQEKFYRISKIDFYLLSSKLVLLAWNDTLAFQPGSLIKENGEEVIVD